MSVVVEELRVSGQDQEEWEREVISARRWGRKDEEEARREAARLRALWEAAVPLDNVHLELIGSICDLEFCNWNLEDSILSLCAGIGGHRSVQAQLGHMASVSPQRWRKVWAYFLACRDWLNREGRGGYGVILRECDPMQVVETHVHSMLGTHTELKGLYVERFCLCLDYWLQGVTDEHVAKRIAHQGAVDALERAIREHEPDSGILKAFEYHGDGSLQVCHHKVFRRYDIILSSIGAEEWRGAMPELGTSHKERAALIETYLNPIEDWLDGVCRSISSEAAQMTGRIHTLLGTPEPRKRFLAALLVSLLRAQAC